MPFVKYGGLWRYFFYAIIKKLSLMEKLKFGLFSIIVLALVGLLLYWSIATIQSGTESKTSQEIKTLEKENENLKKEIKNLAEELNVAQSELAKLAPDVKKEPEITVYKYQSLKDELQKLISDNVFLKEKSRGPKVGTVQTFLNIYNNTSNKADNEYGADTKKRVATFQKDSGLNADGEAGKNTFNKMIEWLKEQ